MDLKARAHVNMVFMLLVLLGIMLLSPFTDCTRFFRWCHRRAKHIPVPVLLPVLTQTRLFSLWTTWNRHWRCDKFKQALKCQIVVTYVKFIECTHSEYTLNPSLIKPVVKFESHPFIQFQCS